VQKSKNKLRRMPRFCAPKSKPLMLSVKNGIRAHLKHTKYNKTAKRLQLSVKNARRAHMDKANNSKSRKTSSAGCFGFGLKHQNRSSCHSKTVFERLAERPRPVPGDRKSAGWEPDAYRMGFLRSRPASLPTTQVWTNPDVF